MQFLVPGINTEAPGCITRAMLDQLVRAAVFYADGGVGGVIVAENAPNVVTTPGLARFIWLESDAALVPTGDFYYYNGSSWQSLSIVDGEKIQDGSIPIDKLSIVGTDPFDILQINAAGTALEWTQLILAIQNGSLTLDKLVSPGAGNFLLSSLGAVTQWETIDDIMDLVSTGGIPLTKLEAASHLTNKYIILSGAGVNSFISPDLLMTTHISDAVIPIAKISGAGGAVAQSIRRNATNTGWEFFTPLVTPPTPPDNPSSYAKIEEVQALGVHAGSGVAGSWLVRQINTIRSNQNNIISTLVAGVFTFGVAGTYRITISAPAFDVDHHKIRLWSINGGVTAFEGSTEQSATGFPQTRSTASGLVTIAIGDAFRIEHWLESTVAGFALGIAGNLGAAEIYTMLEIQKVV